MPDPPRALDLAFTCDRCGECCRVHRVPVTGSDIRRLAKSPRLTGAGVPSKAYKPTDYLELLSPEQVDMVGEPESFALVREGRRLVTLRHSNATKGAGRGCVFLDESASCSLHGDRPLSCRAYPFDRPNENDPFRLGLHPELLCPPETLVQATREADHASDSLAGAYQKWIDQRDRETSRHALWVQSWNRRQRARLRLGRLPEDAKTLLAALVASDSPLADMPRRP